MKMKDPLYMPENDNLQKESLIKLIDTMKDYAILLLDKEGNIQNWNLGASRIKGYEENEIIGKNFSVFYTEKDRQEAKPYKLIEKAKVYGMAQDEGWRVRKDGSLFWGSITINSIHDDEGKLIGFGKITKDLTLKKQAEEATNTYLKALEQKNKELEQFTYIASHDLQEPLRTILSFSDLIQKTYGDKLDENAKLYFQFITKSAKRMQELVKGLLDYGRLGTKKELVLVDCNEIVKEVLADMGRSIGESNAKIVVADLPKLNAYPMELRLLFQNLISNALKFRRKGVELAIKILAKKEKGNWIFSIQDNGIGIEERDQEKIFSIFKRLHNREDYEGTGIGLAHCKKILALHGGSIWVGSKPGEGSTFYFTIPKL